MSGLSRASIANIENGKQRVLLHQLFQFADALQVSLSDLIPENAHLIAGERQREKEAYMDKFRKKLAGSREK